jgi:hypothetical protein
VLHLAPAFLQALKTTPKSQGDRPFSRSPIYI